MVYTYTQTFRIRSYECDLYDHVNNAHYLRYLQETARSARSAASPDPQRIAPMGLDEWIQAIDLEYLVPLRYPEAVDVTFRPLGVQGNLFYQEYEFRKTDQGELAARAVCASRFIRNKNGETAPLPPEFLAVFYPQLEPSSAADQAPFPPPPPPPPEPFQVQRRVAWLDVNARFQVDPAVLLSYLEDCGRQAIAALHWPVERMLHEGFAILLRRNQIEYISPASIDDDLEIATWVSNVRRATATRHYIVRRRRDGETLARVHALGVWVNLETGQPVRISPQMLADFASSIVS